MGKKLLSCFRIAALFLLSSYTALTFAGGPSISVSPIRLNLSGVQPIAVLNFKNEGDESVIMQIQPFSWVHKGKNQDVYTKTKDLLISPPIATINSGDTQIFRVALRRAPNATNQLTYRVYAQEILPRLPKSAAKNTGIQIAMRFGIPVYVAPIKQAVVG